MASTTFEMRRSEQFLEQHQFYGYLFHVLAHHSAIPWPFLKCIAYRYLPEDIFAQFEARMKRYDETKRLPETEIFGMIANVRTVLREGSELGKWMRAFVVNYQELNHAQYATLLSAWQAYLEHKPTSEETTSFEAAWGLNTSTLTQSMENNVQKKRVSSPKKKLTSRC